MERKKENVISCNHYNVVCNISMLKSKAEANEMQSID
jgi:hypothetical protein